MKKITEEEFLGVVNEAGDLHDELSRYKERLLALEQKLILIVATLKGVADKTEVRNGELEFIREKGLIKITKKTEEQ